LRLTGSTVWAQLSSQITPITPRRKPGGGQHVITELLRNRLDLKLKKLELPDYSLRLEVLDDQIIDVQTEQIRVLEETVAELRKQLRQGASQQQELSQE